MASFTQCPILFTLMLLPAITHAAVVEVDSKGGAVLEAADKLMRQKGENTPDLTKVERYLDSEGELFQSTPFSSTTPSAQDDKGGDFHLFSGTDCLNCGSSCYISQSQCFYLNEVFGSAQTRKYEDPIKKIVKKLWKVRFQCTENAEGQWKASFRWTGNKCVIDCDFMTDIDWKKYPLGKAHNDAVAAANDPGRYEKHLEHLEDLAEAGEGMVCKKQAIWSPQAQQFKDMAKSPGRRSPSNRAKDDDLKQFLADPYCPDYSIKKYTSDLNAAQSIGAVNWERLTDREKDLKTAGAAAAYSPHCYKSMHPGWAVRDTIEYLRTQTGTTASTCNGDESSCEGEPSWSPSM